MKPLITVVMPVLNASRTIETALKSIRMQTVADQTEILVIDGGSTDDTRQIAARYGAVVLENPRRLPEHAKQIGMRYASGRYVVEQDSDEELLYPDQLEKRLDFFTSHPAVKCMVCNEQYPGKDGGIVARYVCVCGDPFTQFVYKRKNGVLNTFHTAYSQDDPDGTELRFHPNDVLPIGDGGTTMFDLDWVKSEFPSQWDDISFICSIAARIIQKTGCCGCIREDNIRHHIHTSFKGYLAKLRFRVINNLFHPEESGFSARTEQQSAASAQKLAGRKYWFAVYAATILGPILDSIALAVRYRDWHMALHVIYVYYVCGYIGYCLLLSLFKKSKSVESYGK